MKWVLRDDSNFLETSKLLTYLPFDVLFGRPSLYFRPFQSLCYLDRWFESEVIFGLPVCRLSIKSKMIGCLIIRRNWCFNCLIRLNICICGGWSIRLQMFLLSLLVGGSVPLIVWVFVNRIVLFSFLINVIFFNKCWLIVFCIWTPNFFYAHLVFERWFFLVFNIFYFNLLKNILLSKK